MLENFDLQELLESGGCKLLQMLGDGKIEQLWRIWIWQ